MHCTVRFVDLDVHKDFITIAVAQPQGEPKGLKQLKTGDWLRWSPT